jgi:molybdate transport system substrate-binding protein
MSVPGPISREKHYRRGADSPRFRDRLDGVLHFPCMPLHMTMKRTSLKSYVCAILFAMLTEVPAAAAPAPVVAAASDLQFALTEIAADFKRDTGREVRLVFGSSGNFRRQIAEGAPFELFLSADEAYVAALAKEARTEDGGIRYATGRIVLFAAAGSKLRPDAALTDLKAAVADGRVRHFAIANPEHAPYGRAAKEALQAAGIWEALAPHLVLGENVLQAAQFATTGGAQGGIVAYSLARSPVLAGKGDYVLLPAESHAPLHHALVLVKGAGINAREFFRYLQQPAAREVFTRFGFALPGE